MKVITVENELQTRLVVLRGDICRNLMLNKTCEKDVCKYIHDPSICFHHWKFKQCKYGDTCKKKHVNYTNKYDKNKVKKLLITEKTNTSNIVVTPDTNRANNEVPIEVPIEVPSEVPRNVLNDARMGQSYEWNNKVNERSNRKRVKNTESFEPTSRPVDVRIVMDTGKDRLSTQLTDRDILLVPNLFADYQPGELYNKLLKEINECGIPESELFKLWHGDSHLIADDKLRIKGSRHSWKENVPTFNMIIDRISTFFDMDVKATRYNYYKNQSQWKPFHKDAAAIKPEKAAKQNFTVGVSFGMTRQAAFERDTRDRTVISIPIADGHIYAFCNQTNNLWRHGILQEPKEEIEKGRISIIAWGWRNNISQLN
jgi:hypothetical protein